MIDAREYAHVARCCHAHMHDTAGPLRHASASTSILFLRCLYCDVVGEDPLQNTQTSKEHPPKKTLSTIFQGQCVVLINAEDPNDLSAQQHVRHLHDPPSPVPNLFHCLLTTSNAIHAAVHTSTEQQERIACAGGSSTAMSLGATMSVSRPLLTHACTEREPESPPTQQAS